MNAAQLFCSDHEASRITSTEGPWGDWTEILECPTGTYIVGFRLQVQSRWRGVNNMEVNVLCIKNMFHMSETKEGDMN